MGVCHTTFSGGIGYIMFVIVTIAGNDHLPQEPQIAEALKEVHCNGIIYSGIGPSQSRANIVQ